MTCVTSLNSTLQSCPVCCYPYFKAYSQIFQMVLYPYFFPIVFFFFFFPKTLHYYGTRNLSQDPSGAWAAGSRTHAGFGMASFIQQCPFLFIKLYFEYFYINPCQLISFVHLVFPLMEFVKCQIDLKKIEQDKLEK